MIDGVKIDVPNVSAEWLSNELLDFHAMANLKTGELDGTQTAHYQGLTFIITTSTKYLDTVYCSVRGSLHKYHNKGETNANDFTFEQLQEVIKDLAEKFHIDPATAILRNLEFGVNIFAPITAKALINNLVAYNSHPFLDFKIQGVKVGKGFGTYNYQVKIYDKGKQEKKPIKNLVRVEVAVNKMRYFERYNITTLADLADPAKVQPLGAVLVDYWQTAIYYDKQVNWKQLTDFERKKLLYYATPRNWQDFNRIQRMRAKVHFQKLISRYATTSTHSDTAHLIAKKWDALTAEKCIRMHHDLRANRSRKMYTIAPLECTVQTYTNTLTEIKQKKVQKMVQKKPTVSTEKTTPEMGNFCRTCAKDISHKKANALYCSKRCNNSHHAKERKKKRNYQKKVETARLAEILAGLHRSRLLLLVEYMDNGTPEAVQLYQNEITAPWYWANKVTRVTLKGTGETFTSYRAKKLIYSISKLNIRNNERN